MYAKDFFLDTFNNLPKRHSGQKIIHITIAKYCFGKSAFSETFTLLCFDFLYPFASAEATGRCESCAAKLHYANSRLNFSGN